MHCLPSARCNRLSWSFQEIVLLINQILNNADPQANLLLTTFRWHGGNIQPHNTRVRKSDMEDQLNNRKALFMQDMVTSKTRCNNIPDLIFSNNTVFLHDLTLVPKSMSEHKLIPVSMYCSKWSAHNHGTNNINYDTHSRKGQLVRDWNRDLHNKITWIYWQPRCVIRE